MRARHVAIAGLAALALGAAAAHAGPLSPLPPLPQLPFTVPFPDLGTYNGGVFPSGALLGLGLACNLADGSLACFDTPTQARAAGPTPRFGGRCHPALRVWQDAGRPKRGQLALYHTGYWQELPDGWRNAVSSFATGCDKPARFSDLPAGGGAQLERAPRTASDRMPPGWDDRVDAIYRG